MQIASLVVIIVGILLMFLSHFFFQEIKIKKFSLSTYWIITSLTAIVLLCINHNDCSNVLKSLVSSGSMNPLKIVVLFLSMTSLSIFLDEVGFFNYIAIKVSLKCKSSQIKLFICLYFLVSILTIFTSNDIIILTFTPFICYFCKNAKINPVPYLFSEFVAANTWSMFLMIGNPTNIYLFSSLNLGNSFIEYVKYMAIPTIISSLVAFGLLLLVFNKKLKEPMEVFENDVKSPNKFLVTLGLILLGITIVLVAISSYIGLEMWYITLSFAVLEFIIVLFYCIKNKVYLYTLQRTVSRIPWNFVPFLLSMFIIVYFIMNGILYQNVFDPLMNNMIPQLSAGLIGTIIANIINNIPMSVLYSGLASGNLDVTLIAITSSNIAAFITPMGALAGLMFMKLLANNNIDFKIKDFIKYGAIIGIPTLIVAISTLTLILTIY